MGEDRPIHLSFLSKYSDKKLTYRKFTDDKSYLSYFIKLIRKEKIDMIIPIRDDFTKFFSKYKIILSKFVNFLVPDFDSLKLANNKKKLSHFCLKKGFHVPKILNSKELSSHFGIGQKAIFRPSEGSGSRGITVVDSNTKGDEIDKLLTEDNICQEYIEHNTANQYVVASLFDNNSKPVANFALKKLREYPSSGGPMTYAVSIRNKELVKNTNKLLSELKWKGMCATEYIYDEIDKKYKITEINARYYGAVGTALYSGVNFPEKMFRLCNGENVEYKSEFKEGIKWRWLFPGDFLSAADVRYKKRADFSDFFNIKDTSYAILAFDDFGATVGNFLDILYRLTRNKERSFVLKRGIK